MSDGRRKFEICVAPSHKCSGMGIKMYKSDENLERRKALLCELMADEAYVPMNCLLYTTDAADEIALV